MAFFQGSTPTPPMVPEAAPAAAITLGKQPRNPISRKRVESVLSRSAAGFGIVFGAQAALVMLGQLDAAHPIWALYAVTAVYSSLVVALIASIARRFVRTAHGLVSVLFLATLLTWPISVADPGAAPTSNHWLYYLLTVGTTTAAVAFSPRAATVYLFLVPTVYGIGRLTEAGGGVTLPAAALDSIYAIILGGVVIIIVTMLRQASAGVDAAQATALERYSHAVRQHATEVERVQVDSIVHDTVLTTLLSAARATSEESKLLSAAMADNAIRHLHEAALIQPDAAAHSGLHEIVSRITVAADTMSAPFELRTRVDEGGRELPAAAAEALYSAAVQAMVNSVQHGGDAGDVHRWVSVRADGASGVLIEVGDTGIGFIPTEVPTERLGLRVSILERVANAGGHVDVDSAPGEGTIITMRWPSADATTGPDFDGAAEAATEEVAT